MLVQSTSFHGVAVGIINHGKFVRKSANNNTSVVCYYHHSSQAPPPCPRLLSFCGSWRSNVVMPATSSLYTKIPTGSMIPRSIRSGNGGNKYLAKPVFDHFTAEALQAIIIAYDESRRLGHNYVGTEHIMIGLIAQKTDIAAKLFKLMGINLEDTRLEVERTIGRGKGFFPVEIPFTYRATRVLDHALAEATLLCHDYIGTAHLLLGLIQEEDSVAVTVLERLGIDDLNKIRNQVNRMLSGENTEAVEEKRLSKIEVTINLKYE